MLVTHFLLIATVCCRDTLWLVERGLTILPPGARPIAKKGQSLMAAFLGERSQRTHFPAQILDLYVHGAGIESGYGLFAPNVGDTPRLVFELSFPDGRVTYEPAGSNGNESGLRFASLMDYIGRTRSESLREILINSLAQPIWQRYPDLVKIRAIFGALSFPSAPELLKGKGATYNFVAAYDVPRPATPPAPQ